MYDGMFSQLLHFQNHSSTSLIVIFTWVTTRSTCAYLLFLKMRLKKQQINVNISPHVDSVTRTVTIGIAYVLTVFMGIPSGGIPSKKQSTMQCHVLNYICAVLTRVYDSVIETWQKVEYIVLYIEVSKLHSVKVA